MVWPKNKINLKKFLIKKKKSPDMASCFRRDETETTALDHRTLFFVGKLKGLMFQGIHFWKH